MKELQCEILIVGGGLTGLMSAFALSLLKKNIIIIDSFDFIAAEKDKIDLRTTAIAEGSKEFFKKINIWSKLSKYAEPIKHIKVIDRDENRKINFTNEKKGKNLGYIIRNAFLKSVLVSILQTKKNILFFKNTKINCISQSNDFIAASSENLFIKAKLLIAADGKRSTVRDLLKTPIYFKNYNHNALVVNFHHTKNHNNTAYEFFFNSGPLAILPMQKIKKNLYSSSIIWSNSKNYISNIDNINQDFLSSLLEEKIGKKVGRIKQIVDKQLFNLSAHINTKFYSKRMIYVGDAAHSIHPIAGQGWNLGVRDIENALNVLKEGIVLGLDIGDPFVCKKFHDQSFNDSYSLYQITDKLNSIFLSEKFISNKIRQSGFSVIEKNPTIKKYITNFAMGI